MAVTSSRAERAHWFSVWMSPRTCSNSCPRVSTRSVVSAQYMNASSGSGLCPTRICKAPDASTDLPSAIEEPALEEREDLLARERPRVGRTTVLLEHAHVV